MLIIIRRLSNPSLLFYPIRDLLIYCPKDSRFYDVDKMLNRLLYCGHIPNN